jgi:transposase
MSQYKQHANIKFICRLGKSALKTLSTLQQVYGATALKKSAVYNWFSPFKNGQETLEDDQRSGRPSTSRTKEMIEKVRQLTQCDRRMTIMELEQEVGISHGSIHAILSDDLKMRHVSAKFVARQLTMNQMGCRMMVAGDLFEKSTQDTTFLTKNVMGDESWAFAYEPETKMQSAEWHTSSSPLRKKSRLVKSKEKVMFIAFFDIDRVVHHELIPPGQTVNSHFYVQVLQRLCDAVRRKWRDKWQGEWFLHQDNASSHTLLVVQQFLAEKSIPVINQPPFSSDLAPSDFWLFPTLKMGLKAMCFATMEDIKWNATAELWKIPKEAFHLCFQLRQD